MTVSRTLRTLAWLLLAAMAATLLARQAGWAPGPLVIAVAATPYLLLVGFAATVLAAMARARGAVAAALTLTVAVAAVQAPMFIRDSDPAGQPILRVATANLLYGRADLSRLMQLVREERIDVLAVQEMPPEAAEELRRLGLEQTLPHGYVEALPGVRGSGLWSRWPLSGQRRIDGVSANLLAEADVPGLGPVTFASLHPAAPNPLSTGLWRQEQQQIGRHLSALPGTVVAAGDYNSTADHALVRHLTASGYANASEQAGAGVVRTWPSGRLLPIPLFGIDHVVTKGPLMAASARTYGIAGTDHTALVVELAAT